MILRVAFMAGSSTSSFRTVVTFNLYFLGVAVWSGKGGVPPSPIPKSESPENKLVKSGLGVGEKRGSGVGRGVLAGGFVKRGRIF